MELTEVVSPTVAVPVLCVLVCAFLVFAFGFKSPAQPPSFDVFDEDGKKKRAKKSKGSKGQSNGHAVTAGEGDVNNSAKVQSSPRQTVKQQSSKPQAAVTKSKTAAQPVQENTKKGKKQALKEEEQKVVKKSAVVEDANDVDGWHTVPKKDKKQKKKENESKQERQDSPVKEEEIVVKVEEPALAASSANNTEETPGSPQEQRNKKKKERRNKKTKAEEEVVEQTKVEAQIVKEVAPIVTPEPVVIDTNIEMQIKDAMETTVNNDEVTVEKKKKSKKDKKKVLEDDFVIPQPASVVAEPVQDLPLTENTDALTVKVAKKKQKKDRNKKSEEKLPESLEIGASGELESSLSQSSVSNTQPKKTKLKESVKEVPVVIETSIEAGASSDTAIQGQPSASFDEMGGMTESWTEAKPKSKKKKARRAD